jgi:sigma-B regulation protein RsbU (phosphoserine phosphatase)
MKLDLKDKTSIAVIVIAAILLEATSLIQYWYSREGIRDEVVHRAQTELKVKSLTIKNATLEVETAARNMIWVVEENLQYPDSMYSVIRRLLINNPNILGCGITFKPNYYQSKGYWYEPYGARRENGEIETTQLANENHDYTKMDFYGVPMQTGQPQWSEPYLDSDGARAMLTTYSLPIHDSDGKIVGIMGLDVSLDWMNEYLNSQRIYPSSYNIVVSRKGQLMVAPVESLSMRYTVQELASVLEDTTYEIINNAMMAGESGQSSVIDNEGEKNYVFYGPIEGNTGWSMAVVALDKDIYSSLRRIAFVLFLLMLVGLVLIGVILNRSARSFRRLQQMNAEKERISSELRVASDIQRGMVPGDFPPYPERKDIDVYGFLDSAKAVGGDLFDFYIRDEKLYFCIGDVSGKGVPASLVMAVTRCLFRTVSKHKERAGEIAHDMNNAMCDMNKDDMFVTFFIGKLDLATGLLQ